MANSLADEVRTNNKCLDIPDFFGDAKVNKLSDLDWVKLVDQAASISRWSSRTTTLQAKRAMKSNAADLVDRVELFEPQHIGNWEVLRYNILDTFGPQLLTEANLSVFYLKQDPDEPAYQYANRLSRASNEYAKYIYQQLLPINPDTLTMDIAHIITKDLFLGSL